MAILERKLNPPQISSKLPAFTGKKLIIPFDLTKAVSPVDFDKVAIIVKSVQTGLIKMQYVTTNYYYDSSSRTYKAEFNIDDYNATAAKEFNPEVGQYYKVQIALVSSDTYGYYSAVGVLKYTSTPKLSIQELENSSRHTYTYTGIYSQVPNDDNDIRDTTEKVYSYYFKLYDENNELVAESGELLHNSSNDTDPQWSSDIWTVRKNLNANVHYTIEYGVTTVNGLVADPVQYSIIETETKAPNVHGTLHATNVFDSGYILVELKGDDSGILVNGKFILMRSSSEDNFESWYELTRFDLSQWDSKTIKMICKDRTVKQGIKYAYAIRAYNAVGLFSDRMVNSEGAITADFEDAFLFDGERQLRIRFNPKVTSFKNTVLETKTDTIGGKFPFVFRNGNVSYKEFPISGLISLLSDENGEFLNKVNSEEEFKEPGHLLTTDNIRKEREFKMEVLHWLTNGKPKLFRSPAEGNYIVRLMNTSLSPNDTLGRMLHTFSSTAYEIAEYNFENLKAFGFAMEDYIETRTLRVNQIDLNNPPAEMVSNGVISLPAAVFVSISAAPRTLFRYDLQNIATSGQNATGLTGTYIFPEEVLKEHPLIAIKLLSDSWGDIATLTYGYYDTTADNFSIIQNISLLDKISQIVGAGMDTNLLPNFQDIRTSTGAFHYIKVQPRDVTSIYKQGNNYYYNNSMDKVSRLNPNTLYYIYESLNSGANLTNYYLDGQDGTVANATPKLISSIDYNFRIAGMKDNQVVDFNGRGATTGRYEALTNMSNVSEMYAGNGLIIDLVYQQKEIEYVVEVPGNEYQDLNTISAKNDWYNEYSLYQELIEQGADTAALNAQKAKVDTKYSTYIYWLNLALEHLREEYGVEYAL